MKKLLTLLALATFALSLEAQTMPGDSDIRKILTERIDTQRQSVGIVVGVIDGNGRRVVSHGYDSIDRRQKVDGDTIFEIGSVTKVFTALLLADMAQRGEVALTDPVAKYLPKNVKMPERGGNVITLEHLATHTSGLPRLPSNLAPENPNDPYFGYGSAALHEFLSHYELSRDIGSRYEYSNLGAGLLGHTLALRAGTDYETLVRERILDPLGMKSTSVEATEAMKPRLARGHDAALETANNWQFDALAGAGALRSTANDLLTFLAAAMGSKDTSLAKAFATMIANRRKTQSPDLEIALGWHISKLDGKEIVWHNGGTGGYRSFIGYDANRNIGVVVLSNTSTTNGVDDIGRHLLDSRSKLADAPKQRKEIKLDAKVLDRHVGRYQLAPQFVLDVTREGSRLFVQATGQQKLEVFAETERDFFYKVVDAQLTFETPRDGRSPGVTLHQNRRDLPGRRIEGEVEQPKEIRLGSTVLEQYAGRYQLAPDFVLTVTREGERLFVQATGQPKLEVFARAEREFFYKVVDAQITFTADQNGKITELVLHQNGMEMPGKRIE